MFQQISNSFLRLVTSCQEILASRLRIAFREIAFALPIFHQRVIDVKSVFHFTLCVRIGCRTCQVGCVGKQFTVAGQQSERPGDTGLALGTFILW